jgi:endogenous inhibitor of DNA gyrase (YacG/DUF329 family)
MARAPKKQGKAAEVVPLRPARKCPICGKPAVRAFYPFDSKRCADIDLGRWLTGKYVIPGSEATAANDAEGGDGEE